VRACAPVAGGTGRAAGAGAGRAATGCAGRTGAAVLAARWIGAERTGAEGVEVGVCRMAGDAEAVGVAGTGAGAEIGASTGAEAATSAG
ncbi:hypothetical protein P7D22_22360, partial [Lichenihabitans sp. Uapishka_5]|nr:hypothetical protein [Lichenihabitans sp. Uapishka_5]